ncbi:MAG: YraN family protein [Flavobacteriales bacterium]|nr:YraN family protein [Flavobacteriales bacterium]
MKYGVEDHFHKFWFRFIYKYRSTLEISNIEYLKEIIKRDYATYRGKILENYYMERLMATKQYNTIARYWERNNQNEIDIVAINDVEKKVLFAEVKRNPDKLNLNNLIEKLQNLVPHFKEYQIKYQGFSIQNM